MRSIPRLRILLLIAMLLLVVSTPGSADVPLPAKLRHVTPGQDLSERFLARGGRGEPMLELLVEGDVPPGLLRAQGMEVNTVAGSWMTVRCPLGLLEALLRTEGISRVRVSEPVAPLMDKSAADVAAVGVRTRTASGFSGRTGKGVVVGIVDTGVDLDHADFRAPDGRTRLLSVWDQTQSGTPPSGYTYGVEADSARINAGGFGERDTDGHGTHVLGIAAGNGSATGNGQPAYTYIGMAPEADVIAVKTDFSATGIVDGVSYIFARAAALGKSAVVNLSLGTQDGPHDGTDPMDLMLSALTGPGRIIVVAAGNDGAREVHGHVAVSGATDALMTVTLPTYTPLAGASNDYLLFSGWYPGADSVGVTITTPGGSVIGPVSTGAERADIATPDGTVGLYNAVSSPTNGDHELYVEIYDAAENVPPKTGTWQFRFTASAAPLPGAVDLYLYASKLGGSGQARFATGRMVDGVVSSPGSADSVITVAAHSTRDGWDGLDGAHHSYNPLPVYGTLAYFSSHGPRRDGAQKPDLSAPGHGVISSKSAAYNPGLAGTATDGVHYVNSGTSMAAPHVTGAVALLLADPVWRDASPSAIRDRLRTTARTDSATGVTPNLAWGHGKLDIYRATAPVVAAVETKEQGAPSARFALGPNRPNPFNPSTAIRFELPEAGSVTLRIFAASGSLVRTLVEATLEAGVHEIRWDGRDDAGRAAASGVYLCELAEGGRSVTRRMTLLK